MSIHESKQSSVLSTILPGVLTISHGKSADYRALESFHYLARRPATWAGVWVVRYAPVDDVSQAASRIVAVGVLSYPTPTCIPRETFFGMRGKSFGEKLRFANANLRTISRVIVHPQFRSLGLASTLVRCMCAHCPVRFTEALAVMSQAHPLFEAGGMTRVECSNESTDAPLYFVHERGA